MLSDTDYILKKINLNAHIDPHIKGLVSKLRHHGFETYIVGGAVRDLLINRVPKDYDISTAATPEEIREIFGKRRTKIIGKRFRIVHVFEGRNVVEISTFRKDPSKTNKETIESSGHSIITDDNEYGSSYEDAWRRDFTVNAIFYDPASHEVIDYTSMGLDDLDKKIVRTIGDPYQRFSEDPVRVLRALKLVGQYDFSLEYKTEEALLTLQEKITLSSVSRLSLELEKILKKPFSYKIFKTFFNYGFLSYYIPPLHRHFGKDEGRIGMELLNIECNKLRQKNSYECVSLPIALIAAPAVSYHYTGTPDSFIYEHEHADKKNIRKIIRSLFLPLTFPKFIIHEVADAIFMQSRIFSAAIENQAKRHRHHRNMYTACKLALIINEYSVKDEQVSDFCDKILEDYTRD